MTERKFTDEDVIKALEHCTSSTTSEACNGCPFNQSNICEQMSNGLEIYALDLINRQRAELKALKMDNDQLQSDIVNATMNLESVQHKLDEARAEIEQLNGNLKFVRGTVERQKAEIERLHSEVKEKTETIVFLKDQATGWSIDFCNLKAKLNTAKSEAIKEFAEGLKKRLERKYTIYGREYVLRHLRELVKEMTEGEQ